MSKIAYLDKRFSASSLEVVRQANAILEEYAARGIVVTLRQLYYQFVARDLIANREKEYKRLGAIVNDARMAGLTDWNYLQDRTRQLLSLSHWETPGDVIESAAASYHRDLWQGQDYHVEVWIEKDALVGVIETVCERWDVPYFSCRGYTSQSEMWSAGQRLVRRIAAGRKVRIIHLGDHDPSGLDMSRDIRDRLQTFVAHHLPSRNGHDYINGDSLALALERIALNMDQVRRYHPPPNPAKITDSRAAAYIREYGNESWELDALDPDVLIDLIETSVLHYLDRLLWETEQRQQETEREELNRASRNWPRITKYLEKKR